MAISLYIDFLDANNKETEKSYDNSSYKDFAREFKDFPWARENAYFAEHGETEGGFYIDRNDTVDDTSTSLNFYLSAQDELSGSLQVKAHTGFLGLFGNKHVNKTFEELSMQEAQDIAYDVYNLDEMSLYEKYKK